MKLGVWLCSVCVLLAFGAITARGEIIELGAAADNTLYEHQFGVLSNGKGKHFFSGRTAQGEIRRGLVRFDVASALPSFAVVTSAQLVLHMSQSTSGGRPVALHRTLGDWGEGESVATGGEGTGTNAMAGDATWLHTFFDNQFWSSPGGDFDAVASSTTTVASTGFYTWSSAQLTADVQAFLDDPGTDFGWMLINNEITNRSAKRFDTVQNPDALLRPKLVITYNIPAPGGVLAFGAALVLGMRRGRSNLWSGTKSPKNSWI